MKKHYRIIFIIVFISVSLPTSAQLKWGIKTGINMSAQMFGDLSHLYQADGMTGFFVGPVVDFKSSKGFGFDLSLLYSKKGTKITNNRNEESIVNWQHMLELPVHFNGSVLYRDFARFYFAVGPNFAVNLKNNINKNISRIADSMFPFEKISRKNYSATLGLDIGGGIVLADHYLIGFNYTLPVTEYGIFMLDKGFTEDANGFQSRKIFSVKNSTRQIFIAYLF